MKRRPLILAIVLLLALLTSSALATGNYYTRPNSIKNQVEILAVTDRNGVVTQLSDDARNTVWYCPSSYAYNTDTAALTLIVDSQSTIREIWVRNGSHVSQSDYYANSRPSIMVVKLYYGNGQSTAYRYLMAEAFSVSAVASSWNNGYQRIELPKTFNQVYCIELKIETINQGTNGSTQAAISDIVLSSGQDEGGASNTSAPISTPKPTQPPQPEQTLPPGYDTTVGVRGTLTQRMATRTGPSNTFDEPGSFFTTGAPVQVITKVYDNENELYWLQLEFVYGGEKLRAYTTDSRVNVDLAMIPNEDTPTRARVVTRTSCYYGPGTDYKAHGDQIIDGTSGMICARERGYVLFEWYDYYRSVRRRAWIPANTVVDE